MVRSERIAVFGAGGVGGYFGGRLASAGHLVTFIARGAHLDAIRQRGLRVSSPNGSFVVDPATATDDPASVGQVDLVLLALKAGSVPDVAERLRSLVGPDTVVVPLQNGVETLDHLESILGRLPVVGGLCRIVSSIAEPGHIVHAGIEPTIVIGELDGTTTDRLERVRALLIDAGVAAEITSDIPAALWEKFLLIAPWGGLGAVTRVTLDVLCQTPETRQLLRQAMTELAAVAAAAGVALPQDAVDRTLTLLSELPPGNTASMQRDLMEGRPSELEEQTGAIVRLGRLHGVPTPVNGFLYACLLPTERRARAS